MDKMEKESLLRQHIQMLNLSAELKALCQTHRIETLAEVVVLGGRRFQNLPGFRQALLMELITFLEFHQLDEYIEKMEDN